MDAPLPQPTTPPELNMGALSDALTEAQLSRIEDVSLNASAPPQQRWLDGWMLRYCPGKAKRARSVQTLAGGRMALSDRLAAAAALMAEAGLPLLFRITPFSQPRGLDAWLAGQGFHRFDETRVMVLPTLADLPDADAAIPQHLALRRLDHAEFAEQVGVLRGTPADQRQSHAQRLIHSPSPYQGWVLQQRDGGLIVACGQTAAEAEFVGLYDVFTHPQHRGQGLSRRLCAALLVQAREQGARTAYLQVDAANAPARAVYRRLGFADAYSYHYRALDPHAE